MSNYTFEFHVDSYWSDNGCDCCEASEVIVYNEIDSKVLGTCESKEECYARAIEQVLDLEPYSINEYDRTLEDLEQQSDSLNIQIIFNNEQARV